MNLKGSFHVDVTRYQVKTNNSNDGQTATVDILMAMTRAELQDATEKRFEQLAFGSQFIKKSDPAKPKSVDKIAYLQDKIKPGKNLIFQRHVMDIDGKEITEQPEVLSLEPVEGEERVKIKMRIPIDVKLAHRMKLDTKVGDTITITFNPEQSQFDFGEDGVAEQSASMQHPEPAAVQ